ncbi:MAG: hypothetical protein NC209_01075 [Alistipes sp.]|nr:hypothetical protein [Alistipes senegalensis]MCM1249726.1 hypothetical protein [Alistipes sp.]
MKFVFHIALFDLILIFRFAQQIYKRLSEQQGARSTIYPQFANNRPNLRNGSKKEAPSSVPQRRGIRNGAPENKAPLRISHLNPHLEKQLQMLDAAHGEAVGTVEVVHRIDIARSKSETARIHIARSVRRSGPVPTARADTRQSSRREVAEARGIHKKAIAGMNGGKGAAIKN